MPVVLILAFAASLGVHALALFAPDVDLSIASEPPPLVAELKPVPKAAPLPEPMAEPVARTVPAKGRVARRRPAATTVSRPVPNVPESPALIPESVAAPAPAAEPAPSAEVGSEPEPAAPEPVQSRFPVRGLIRYRVDRGDQGFQIGVSTHDWAVVDGAYRITAVTDTSGLIGLFRPLRFEVESRGRLTAAGLLPEHVVSRQKGRGAEDTADFDWAAMQLHVSGRPVQTLRPGTQDLLSFPYQLGLISDFTPGSSLPIATGKKYANYRVEVVGDEEIQVPAGTFRCLHLRIPGVATTELWLAYDRSLLPVKIQHIDRKGDLFVQVATAIELSEEP
jgi:hypothetical protein